MCDVDTWYRHGTSNCLHLHNVPKGKVLSSAVSSPWDCSKCFTLHPWQTCSFTLQPLLHLFLYTSPPVTPVPLHFTPWQTCYFTLHTLVDLFLYTSPHGRLVLLHFTPWHTCSFTLHPCGIPVSLHFTPLVDLFLYTSPPW